MRPPEHQWWGPKPELSTCVEVYFNETSTCKAGTAVLSIEVWRSRLNWWRRQGCFDERQIVRRLNVRLTRANTCPRDRIRASRAKSARHPPSSGTSRVGRRSRTLQTH